MKTHAGATLILVAIVAYACAPTGSSPTQSQGTPTPAGSAAAGAPIGSWTSTLTGADLQAAGFSEPGAISENAGTFTLTFGPDGTWTLAQVTDHPVRWPVFRGPFATTGPGTLEMTTAFPEAYAGEVVAVEWTMEGGGLRLHLISPDDPLIRAQLETHVWAPAP